MMGNIIYFKYATLNQNICRLLAPRAIFEKNNSKTQTHTVCDGGDANDRTLYSEENRSGGFEYQIVNCPDFRLIVTLADNSATITEKQLISTKKNVDLIISGS